MPYCPNCRTQLDDETTNYCPTCGASLQGNKPKTPLAKKQLSDLFAKPAAVPAPDGLNRREFYRGYSNGARNCVLAAGICYLVAGLTIAASFTDLLDGIYYVLPDVLIIVALSAFVHAFKSRIASALLFAFGMFSFLYTIIVMKEASGWLLPLAGVIAVIGSFTAVKEWKAYCTRVQIPAPEQPAE